MTQEVTAPVFLTHCGFVLIVEKVEIAGRPFVWALDHAGTGVAVEDPNPLSDLSQYPREALIAELDHHRPAFLGERR